MEINDIRLLARKEDAEIVETHISFLLLGKEFVYKIKKPVAFTFLDFSTLEKRRFFCEEEVRLNQRLSPEIYLCVVPISKNGYGIMIGGDEPVEYAVKMKRLDNNRMMDRLLDEGKVGEGEIRALSGIIADFHSRIDQIKKDYGTSEIVLAQILDLGNHRGTIESACSMGKTVDFVLEKSRGFILGHEDVFRKRIEDGMVRDCHGDLHSGNIFIEEKPVIIDCIEFSKDFRFVDVASEIAFMAMDLDYHGKENLGKTFVSGYISRTGDRGLETLLPLYKCYRANVRAKIAAIEFTGSKSDDARKRMERYLLLAERYAKNL